MEHFRTYGWLYRPISIIGWCVSIITIAFNVNVFLAIDRQSHSVSDTLYGFYPYCVSSLTVLFWIAFKSISNNKK